MDGAGGGEARRARRMYCYVRCVWWYVDRRGKSSGCRRPGPGRLLFSRSIYMSGYQIYKQSARTHYGEDHGVGAHADEEGQQARDAGGEEAEAQKVGPVWSVDVGVDWLIGLVGGMVFVSLIEQSRPSEPPSHTHNTHDTSIRAYTRTHHCVSIRAVWRSTGIPSRAQTYWKA